MEDPSVLLTRRDIESRLRLGKTAVQALITSGSIPSFMIGGSRRVRLVDFQNWIDAQAHQSRAA